MKKFIYGLLGFAAISFTGCDYHDPNADKFNKESSVGWVEFEGDDINYFTVVEGTETTLTAMFPVKLKSVDIIDLNDLVVPNTPVNDGLTVNYIIEDLEGSSYVVTSGSVYIPKGESTADIFITVPASAQVSCSRFNVVLTSTSNPNVTVGIEGHDTTSQEFAISKFDLASYVGNYSVLHTFENDDPATYNATLALGSEENSLILTGVYNTNSPIKVYVNTDGTLAFPEDYTENFLLNQSGTNFYFYGDEGYLSCYNGGTVSIDFRVASTSGIGTPENLLLTKN